ncbi:hypothetical protein C5E07_09825 [Pseudoclavibacter sp. RFBJ3]|uniref:hypothetical protein n=1 Tax=unclassified Pseudoclavibacter TaxID=2615177 RepID=UPI000CE9031F|nr:MULTISPECIES: hypothetical protein [unclassified Pseudoclavibacter]PPF83782.1 hypothetical protein C5C12_08905 [Pseudoclavibacter sp. RFBJ5]PPF92062.1 hypothetical protein C5E07_09825 [Pseudoclavibacter sp. RFBJ3]PPF96925.1 hypothetical protein C5C19_13135 [Pseudoclavibacter sp. RFBH5]PPG23612.1 hypothetical protein C5E13_08520 [Pseudoclavibacter sp. RFBI4]
MPDHPEPDSAHDHTLPAGFQDFDYPVDPDPDVESSLHQQTLESLLFLGNEIDQWLEARPYEQSDQSNDPWHETALRPWAQLFRHLLSLAAGGPFQGMTAGDLRMWHSNLTSSLAFWLTEPAADVSERLDSMRSGVTNYIEVFGARRDQRGSAFISRPEWLTLLVRAGSQATSDETARMTNAAIDQATRSTANAVTQLESAIHHVQTIAEGATQAAKRAENAEVEARKAAGEKGLDEFGDRFRDYGDAQLKSAKFYRVATIGVLIAALAVAVVLVLRLDAQLIPAELMPDPDAWHTLVYRFAIIAGLTGLSAYLGRQAAQHRKLGDWAKTLEVQSRSFGAFVQPIPDAATKNSVYSAMSARLLAAPPEKSGGEQEVSSTAVDRLVDAIIRRS